MKKSSVYWIILFLKNKDINCLLRIKFGARALNKRLKKSKSQSDFVAKLFNYPQSTTFKDKRRQKPLNYSKNQASILSRIYLWKYCGDALNAIIATSAQKNANYKSHNLVFHHFYNKRSKKFKSTQFSYSLLHTLLSLPFTHITISNCISLSPSSLHRIFSSFLLSTPCSIVLLLCLPVIPFILYF